MLESNPRVKAVFHGHDHDSAGKFRSSDTPYLFLSRTGGSWGNKRGYRIVKLREGQSILTYQYSIEDSEIMNRHAF